MIAIACRAANRVIGNKGELPWPSIKEDFAFFRKITIDRDIIVGRKTFEKLPPLKKRNILVLSRITASKDILKDVTSSNGAEGKLVNLDYILETEDILYNKRVVCGGAEIYELLLPKITDFYVTELKESYPGDTYLHHFEDKFDNRVIIESHLFGEMAHYYNISPVNLNATTHTPTALSGTWSGNLYNPFYVK